MRADRLISILLLLQMTQRLTARALAERLEVSERTIHRDMLALSAAGIPVVAERGVNGGWSLLENYRTNLTGLNAAELQTLFLSSPSNLLADLGLEKASEAALIKLLAALPSLTRQRAADIRQRIYIDAAGWHPSGESFPLLPVLQDAIWQERKLHVCYERGEGKTVERLCDPLGLVAKGNVWYLVAVVEGEIRTYRVSRILDAHLTEQSCTRPEGFDLAEFWQQSTRDFVANLPSYRAVFRVSSEVFPFFRGTMRNNRIEQIDAPDAEGWQQVHLRFDVEDEACLYGLGYGAQVEVIEPPALREKVLRMGQRVIDLYSPHR